MAILRSIAVFSLVFVTLAAVSEARAQGSKTEVGEKPSR